MSAPRAAIAAGAVAVNPAEVATPVAEAVVATQAAADAAVLRATPVATVARAVAARTAVASLKADVRAVAVPTTAWWRCPARETALAWVLAARRRPRSRIRTTPIAARAISSPRTRRASARKPINEFLQSNHHASPGTSVPGLFVLPTPARATSTHGMDRSHAMVVRRQSS